ncbi:MAG: L7Ae/L30e/S12e/Gadd45 family ribosomal protein [Candidatus Scatovivens sp.]
MINKTLGLLGISAKAGKLVSGNDIVLENIKKRKIKLIIIAKDTSDRTKKNINDECHKNKIPIIEFGTIEENSKAIGKNNRAIIGITDIKLADAILNKISGGEDFGEN